MTPRLTMILLACLVSRLFTQCESPLKTKYQTDFILFIQIVKQAHPGIYKYHSLRQVDSVFAHYQHQITDSTDLVTLYSYLASTITYLG